MKIFVSGIQVEVIRKKNLKNINLRIRTSDGYVSVSAPLNADYGRIERFLKSKESWLIKHTERLKTNGQKSRKTELVNLSLGYLIIFGEKYELELLERDGAGYSFLKSNDKILMAAPKNAAPESRRSKLEIFLRETLRREIEDRMVFWEVKTGLKCASWSIGNMSSRWGSCNVKTKKIRFSVYLVLLPLKCLDYIIVHELGHLVTRFHDLSFYAFVERYIPDWRSIRKSMRGIDGLDS